MKTWVRFLALTLILGSCALPGCASRRADENLTSRISGILKECETIKPGMTRAELYKFFTTEGGISFPGHRTYVYRGCPNIKVDVDFTLADPKENGMEEDPRDTIRAISKPYLEWMIGD